MEQILVDFVYSWHWVRVFLADRVEGLVVVGDSC